VIRISAKNGVKSVAGINDIIKEKRHVALRLPPNNTDLNSVELVCTDIKKQNSFNEFERNENVL
jgi:transposase